MNSDLIQLTEAEKNRAQAALLQRVAGMRLPSVNNDLNDWDNKFSVLGRSDRADGAIDDWCGKLLASFDSLKVNEFCWKVAPEIEWNFDAENSKVTWLVYSDAYVMKRGEP